VRGGLDIASGWTERFDGHLAVRPPLGPAELAELPARRGVFLLLGPKGQPVLLATAASIRARVGFRLAAGDERAGRRADLRGVTAGVMWKLADSHFETDWQFLELARAIYPDTYRDLLALRPPWFVRVAPGRRLPTFRRVRGVVGRGRYFGPFPHARAASRFVEILQDVFGLCRSERLLEQGGRGCVYAQMGRCPAPCRGGPAAEAYRGLVERACRCAEGDRESAGRWLTEQMQRFSAARQYEQAGKCRARLERLEELAGQEFGHVASAERFQFLLFQRGPGSRAVKAFLADRGAIALACVLEYPPAPAALRALLAAMEEFTQARRAWGPVEQDGMALLCRYLFASPERRGLAVRYDPALSPEALAGSIEQAAASLKLRRSPEGTRRPRPA